MIEIPDTLVVRYKAAFGDYMTQVADGLLTPPSADVSFHATKAALNAVFKLGLMGAEPIAWESKTVCFIRYIPDSRYRHFKPEVRRWYKPYRCSHCAAAEVQP